MIRNDEELAIVQTQLARVEAALHSITRDVLPQSTERFALMAEAYVDQISEIRAQIDAYVGFVSALEARGDLVISFEGSGIRLGEVAVSLVTQFLDKLRKGMQRLLAQREIPGAGAITAGRRARWVEELSDPPLLSVSPGSVRIQLGVPVTQGLLRPMDQQSYRDTFALLRSGIAWASEEDTSELDRLAQTPELRQTVLNVVLSLVPPTDSPMERVGFGGQLVGRKRRLVLTKESRPRIKSEIGRVEPLASFEQAEGTMREIDLDKNHFILRERPANQPPLGCFYDEKKEMEIKEYLDQKVLVRGVIQTTRPNEMHVQHIETHAGEEPSPTA